MPFFLISITRQLKLLGTNPGVLISGDPYISGLFIYLLKQFKFRNALMQFQVHGHPFHHFKTFSIKQSILKLIFEFNLNHADCIRLVSESQLQYDFLESPVKKAKIFISPIPIINLSMDMPKEKHEDGMLFLGRFHQERNLDLWLEIAENIALQRPEFKITMAGSGPLMEYVINYKTVHSPLNSLKLLGEVPHNKIEEVLHANTILLSTAVSESYGLSLREAMLSGLFVVAKRNSTTIPLESEFPNLVRTFNSATEATDIIVSLVGRAAPKDEISEVKKQQTIKNLQSVNTLVQTWIVSQ